MSVSLDENVVEKWWRVDEVLLFAKVFFKLFLAVKNLRCMVIWMDWMPGIVFMFRISWFMFKIFIFPLDMLVLDLKKFHNCRRFLLHLTLIGFSFKLSKLIQLFFQGVDSVSRLLIQRVVSHHKRWLGGLGSFHSLTIEVNN